jgi:mono/diheme cytochrome c family protein
MGKMKRFFVLFVLLFLVACATTAEETVSEGETMAHTDDHAAAGEDQHGAMGQHIHAAAPEEYADLTNPMAGDETAVAAGKSTFEIYCMSCHGEGGQGDGPAAEALNPKPADLTDGMMMTDLGDEYLFWRISEGGAMEPFNSAMPAWKNSLSEDQRWQLVTFVRSLADKSAGHMDEHSDSH